MINITKDNIDEFIKKDFVIVDFYADWCGPCRQLLPILEELPYEIGKANIDSIDASKYEITSLPTLIAYSKEKELSRIVATTSDKSKIINWIDSLCISNNK